MADIVVISPGSDGLWHADLYRDADEWIADDWDSAVPDAHATFKGSREIAGKLAACLWGNALVVPAADEDDDTSPG